MFATTGPSKKSINFDLAFLSPPVDPSSVVNLPVAATPSYTSSFSPIVLNIGSTGKFELQKLVKDFKIEEIANIAFPGLLTVTEDQLAIDYDLTGTPIGQAGLDFKFPLTLLDKSEPA